MYGYAGKILDIDLSAARVTQRDLEPQFAREFIGGMGFSCKLLYEEVGRDVEPLSPDNVVILAAGPLTRNTGTLLGQNGDNDQVPAHGSYRQREHRRIMGCKVEICRL